MGKSKQSDQVQGVTEDRILHRLTLFNIFCFLS